MFRVLHKLRARDATPPSQGNRGEIASCRALALPVARPPISDYSLLGFRVYLVESYKRVALSGVWAKGCFVLLRLEWGSHRREGARTLSRGRELAPVNTRWWGSTRLVSTWVHIGAEGYARCRVGASSRP